MEEYSVLQCLPDNGKRCLCFGHKTMCCKEDMDDKPTWHEVKFEFLICSYCLKKKFPEDIEESILECCEMTEYWVIDSDEEPKEHVIGVTKWKKLKE